MTVNNPSGITCTIVVALALLEGGLSAAPTSILEQFEQLPLETPPIASNVDYLIDPTSFVSRASRSADGRELILENGLIRRAWRIAPNGACVSFDNLMTGQSMLRSVRPEARVTIDGKSYSVGGLIGQPNHAYLDPDWLDEMQSDRNALQLVGFAIGEPVERFGWGRWRHASPAAVWPPKGVYLRMDYALPSIARVRLEFSLLN